MQLCPFPVVLNQETWGKGHLYHSSDAWASPYAVGTNYVEPFGQYKSMGGRGRTQPLPVGEAVDHDVGVGGFVL